MNNTFLFECFPARKKFPKGVYFILESGKDLVVCASNLFSISPSTITAKLFFIDFAHLLKTEILLNKNLFLSND